jgi:hypothetical protein
MTAAAARTDLLTHRYPIKILEAARGPVPIDQVTIRGRGTDTPAGVAWAAGPESDVTGSGVTRRTGPPASAYAMLIGKLPPDSPKTVKP